MVKGATNANLYQFFTGKHDTLIGTAYNPIQTDSIITLPELLGVDRPYQSGQLVSTGRSYNLTAMKVSPSLQLAQMKDNVATNWFEMATTAIVVPIGFKIGKRLAAKTGVSRGVNKVFKMAGLSEVRV